MGDQTGLRVCMEALELVSHDLFIEIEICDPIMTKVQPPMTTDNEIELRTVIHPELTDGAHICNQFTGKRGQNSLKQI